MMFDVHEIDTLVDPLEKILNSLLNLSDPAPHMTKVKRLSKSAEGALTTRM